VDGPRVAVDKPAGWVVYAAMRGETHDLAAWLAAQPGLPPSLSPCHRLDRETSGAVLYAATPEARGEIGTWFQEGRVEKTYIALVIGHAHQKGVIRAALAPDDGGAPQEALTRYRLVAALGGFSLLRVRPETGRKHQVRRHLSGVGLPLVGDTRYPGLRRVRVPAFPGRLFLHATALALPDGTRVDSPLPLELARCLEALGYTTASDSGGGA
jgi:23S rRNA-/tRNA-specific pseudouridylate synthase